MMADVTASLPCFLVFLTRSLTAYEDRASYNGHRGVCVAGAGHKTYWKSHKRYLQQYSCPAPAAAVASHTDTVQLSL